MDVSFLLEEALGRKVEIVTPEGLSPHIGPHILKEVERVPVAA
jgi:predicted nucleotidyltransferase